LNLVNLVDEKISRQEEFMSDKEGKIILQPDEDKQDKQFVNKGVIDSQGTLILFRGGRRGWVKARCYLAEKEGHKENSDFPYCSDNCALFGNPDTLTTGETLLPLCKRTWVFKEFEDERVYKTGK